ncbi:DUF3153 domain-containing protein [Chamaesiphon sp. VAR_48_metabat_403]|uniref:DUF3153 domain-containing protein n=1 Tax=Chamaesiphon sp. VAR_48_metabat_403 TaxID=2964700 RepID=UPI00286E2579|nr:DUF3153 domain-containing protein [Chamaesiphon sp. VAR_48_metabat_403]
MKILVGANKSSEFVNWLHGFINRQLIIVFLTISLGLSGCVKYDTGINFTNISDGEIVEHIQLGEQLNTFSQNAVKTWIASIRQRTMQAQGHLERLSDREYKVTIPFNNPQELVTKIARYFNPNSTQSGTGPQLNSQMQIDRSNFFLVIRNHLTYDIDLRALSIDTVDAKISVDATNSVNLNFSIYSPWGVKNIATDRQVVTIATSDPNQLTWQLKPGRVNHIDAIFWLPNPLALGAVVIVLISAIGYYIKYRQLPWQLASK